MNDEITRAFMRACLSVSCLGTLWCATSARAQEQVQTEAPLPSPVLPTGPTEQPLASPPTSALPNLPAEFKNTTEQAGPQETAQPSAPPPGGNTVAGFIDLNLYPYLQNKKARDDSVGTVDALAIMGYGFSYYGFVNFNNTANRKPLMETNGYYSEQTLYWSPAKAVPLDALVQWNARSGDNNDRLRLGIRVRVDDVPYLGPLLRKIHVSYGCNFHFYQLDHQDRYVWQIEQYGRLDTPWLDDRFYISAFGDRTFNENIKGLRRKSPLVTEIQFGGRLFDQLYLVYEFRALEYRANAVVNGALGGQYVAKW